jgi:hypothetical protein
VTEIVEAIGEIHAASRRGIQAAIGFMSAPTAGFSIQ